MLIFKIVLFTFFILYSPQTTNSSPLLNELYINPIHQNKPIAIIFYNSLNPCQNCNNAITITTDILRKNYYNQIKLYLIDLNNHPEFISTFKLKGPLNLVIIKISDKASFGYKKITGLQSKTDDLISLNQLITNMLANFLNIYPQN